MGFRTKILLPLILATICLGAEFAIGNAVAGSEIGTDKNSVRSRDQKINALSEKISELNKKLVEADRLTSDREEISDLNKKIGELKDAIADSKKTSFDSTSTVLNILIAFSAFVITGVGVAFGILAFFGIKGYKEIKKEISEQLDSTSAEINNRLSSKYKETVEQYFQSQGSVIREEFSNGLRELEEKIDECCKKASAEGGAKPVPQVDQQSPSGNVFDDIKS